jgi:tetraacyldisaccharide 4'-kinase
LWQLLYGSAHAARRRFWRSRAARLPRPVVSVGNLHWGGAGKTPVTAAVAAHLRDRGQRVAILTRGYGRARADRRAGRSDVRLVSTGGGPLLGPAVAGDEPVLLAGELPGVAVVVGAERLAAGRYALAHLDPPPDLFVLDDGFSHVRLARDVDLLVFPAADPFAGGRLPPGGRLREPLASAAWADAALLTGSPEPGDAAALRRALAEYGFRGPAFAAPARFGPPRWAGGDPLDAGTRVLLVCGVARPDSFREAVRPLGLTVTGELRFGDHHAYPEASLERIRSAFCDQGAAAVLTTAKDRVKLLGRLHLEGDLEGDLPLAELPLAAEPEPAFWSWLDDRLEIETRGASGGEG